MYQALYLVEKKFPYVKAGFMHIPYMMEQVVNRPTTPTMSLVDIRRGIEAAIGAMNRTWRSGTQVGRRRNSLIEKSLRGKPSSFWTFSSQYCSVKHNFSALDIR
ncbi:pyrrolidone carboxyl peptidase, truncation [Streptococcus pneumoniae]|nr:pyrrolidone carboxyl peptidase, truncation [Streptococcus pneumoniae]CAG5536313.1 pyrrolidone carboxyl peptidase, truncation [Streptococcus pneumoniae]SNN60109.1 pyrrolidone carboxyl peptidase, truncation [Streptococcus pneumoniae]SNP86876.1 pyrrolidone carboxyl peptidase, truncation [Streptococcus pneumoniae]VKY02885.1 pyrrolidone carboxyl peptidase, truncation [Streptococcus pneumoniae]